MAIALLVFDIFLAFYLPKLSGQLVEKGGVGGSAFLLCAGMLGLFWTLEKILGHIQDIIFFPVINHCIRAISLDVVQQTHQIPLTQYQTLSIPEILSAVRRISPSARAFFRVLFLLLLPTLIKITLCMALLTKLKGWGFLLVPLLLGSVAIMAFAIQWYVSAREHAWRASDVAFMSVSDSLYGTKIIRSTLSSTQAQINETLGQEAKLWQRANLRMQLAHIAIVVTFGLVLMSLLTIAALSVNHHSLTLGDVVMLQGQWIAAFIPLKSLALEFRQLAESLIDIQKISQFLSLPADPRMKSELTNPIILSSEKTQYSSTSPVSSYEIGSISFHIPLLEFKAANFSYDKKLLLNQISGKIYAGEKIGLLGDNGSGKSTLACMMAGLLCPHTGEIHLAQQCLSQVSPEQIAPMVHLVPQNAHVFNQSILANVTLGVASWTQSEVLNALARVGMSEFISNLSQGLQTLTGEMGIRLSGGEKQRLALARALLHKSTIIILDESFHALPHEDAKNILQVFLSNISTVILISHDFRLQKMMDRHFLLARGYLQELPPNSFDNAVNIAENRAKNELANAQLWPLVL